MPDISALAHSTIAKSLSLSSTTIPLPVSSPTSNVETDINDTPETADTAESTSPISPASSKSPSTLYFAYGSNLSTTQMEQRCDTSRLYTKPLAVLHDYEWFIASRGYASVRPAKGKKVYGLLFELDEEAEYSLDLYEGVGQGCYYKEEILVGLLAYPPPSYYADLPDHQTPELNTSSIFDTKVKALVYINCTDEEGELGDAYASRLKRGAEESGKLGLEIGDSFGKWTEQVMNAEEVAGRRKVRRRELERESSGPVVGVGSERQEELEISEVSEQERRGMRDYHCC